MSKGQEISFDESARLIAWCRGDLNRLYYQFDQIKDAMRLTTFRRIVERRIGTKQNITIIRELLNSDFTNKATDMDHLKHITSMLYEFNLDRDIFKFERIVRYCQKNKLGSFA